MSVSSKHTSLVVVPAPAFTMQGHQGDTVSLKDALLDGPVMLVFYPKDFTPVCTQQLCDYRDNLAEFEQFGIQIFAISHNDQDSHAQFVDEHNFPFVLLTDTDNKVAKSYDCTSRLMLGKVSRAIVLVNTKGEVIYRHVEATPLTRRKSHTLLARLRQLSDDSLI